MLKSNTFNYALFLVFTCFFNLQIYANTPTQKHYAPLTNSQGIQGSEFAEMLQGTSDVIILLDQYGGLDDMTDYMSGCQDFETVWDDYDIAAVEDMEVNRTCQINQILCGLGVWNSCDPSIIQGYKINIHDSIESAESQMDGNVASLYIDSADTAVINLDTDANRYLIYFDEALTGAPLSNLPILTPGSYWLSIVPVNDFNTNGSTGIAHSTLGNDDAFTVNPGMGFGNGVVNEANASLSYSVSAFPRSISVPDDFATISEAIEAADAEGAIIDVGPGVYNEQINVTNKDDFVLRSTSGPEVTRIVGDGNDFVVGFGNVTQGLLEGFSIEQGGGANGGGVILAYCDEIDVVNCHIKNNHTTDSGGGMAVIANVDLVDVLFEANSSNNGGGLEVIFGQVLIDDCNFNQNIAYQYGGALYARGVSEELPSNVKIMNTNFYQNAATNSGGAIASVWSYENGAYIPTYANFEIGFDNYVGNVATCTFIENEALGTGSLVGKGGAIFLQGNNEYIYGLPTVIANSIFESNNAEWGGGAYFDTSYGILVNSFIRNNQASSTGGGIRFETQGNSIPREIDYSVLQCIFEGNRAQKGGGFSSQFSTNIKVDNSLVVSNQSETNGAGVSMVEGNLKAFNTIFWNNMGANGTDLEAQAARYGEPLEDFAFNSIVQGAEEEVFEFSGRQFKVFNQDPRFLSLLGSDGIPSTGDENYRLLATSPAIDAGNNWTYVIGGNTFGDFDGNERWQDDPYTTDQGEINDRYGKPFSAVVDIGPFEHTANNPNEPGFKIWSYDSSFGTIWPYNFDSSWLPDFPFSSDTAIVEPKDSAFGINQRTNSYLTADSTHERAIIPSGINVIFGNGFSYTLENLGDEPELVIGPYEHEPRATLQFEFSDFNDLPPGELVIEHIEIHGEGHGLFKTDPGVLLKTGLITVEPDGELLLLGDVERLTSKSQPVEILVNGIFNLSDSNASFDGAFSLNAFANNESSSQEGLVEVFPNSLNDSWPTFADSIQLSGSMHVLTNDLQSAAVGSQYVLLESEGSIKGSFNCVTSTGFSDDRFIYITIEDSAKGQQVVANVESTSNILGFGDPESTVLSGNPADAELGDMNGDGELDLVISLPGVDQIAILLNGGEDSSSGEWLGFSAGTISMTVDSLPLGLAIGDVAGDDALDIAVACKWSDAVVVLENISNTGSFTSTSYDVGGHITAPDIQAEPVDVAIGNFDGNNGDNDIACVNIGDGSIVLLTSGTTRMMPLNNGGSIQLGLAGTTIDPGDVNNDKDLDKLISSGRNEDKVAVVKGTTAFRGGDVEIEYYDVGSIPNEVAVGDINGDGLVDILTANEGSNSISILIQDATGNYLPATAFALGDYSPVSVTIGDFDLDNDNDIGLVLSEVGTGDLSVRSIRNDSISNSLILSLDEELVSGGSPSLVRNGDVNQDGATDLVIINSGGSNFAGDGEDADASTLISSSGLPNIDNETCLEALSVGEGMHKFSTIGANTDGPEGDGCKFDMPHNDIWYTYTATCSGMLTISTCGTVDYDSNIALYTGSCERLELVGCNDDGDGCPDYSSELVTQVIKGQTYLIEIGGWNSASEGSGTFSITLDVPESEAFFDQIGNGCDELPAGTSASQYFESSFSVYDVAAIESFTITSTTIVNSIETVINGWNGYSGIDAIQWYEINIYSSVSQAGTSLMGDVVSEFIPASDIEVDENWDSDGSLITVETQIVLDPGTYYISVIPRNNFSENGQSGIRHGINGDGVSHGANPNGGFGNGDVWSAANDLAYRLFGQEGIACTGDFNNDLEVGVDDLLELIASWGSCAGCEPDLNGDGEVGVDDLLELIANWGSCL